MEVLVQRAVVLQGDGWNIGPRREVEIENVSTAWPKGWNVGLPFSDGNIPRDDGPSVKFSPPFV